MDKRKSNDELLEDQKRLKVDFALSEEVRMVTRSIPETAIFVFNDKIRLPFCLLCRKYIKPRKDRKVNPVLTHFQRKHQCVGDDIDSVDRFALQSMNRSILESEIDTIDWSRDDQWVIVESGFACTILGCGYAGCYDVVLKHCKASHIIEDGDRIPMKRCNIKRPFHSSHAYAVDVSSTSTVPVSHEPFTFHFSGKECIRFDPAIPFPFCVSCVKYIRVHPSPRTYPLVTHVQRVHHPTPEEMEKIKKIAKECHFMQEELGIREVNWKVDDNALEEETGFSCMLEGCTFSGSTPKIQKHFREQHPHLFWAYYVRSCIMKRPFFNEPSISYLEDFPDNPTFTPVKINDWMISATPSLPFPYCSKCERYILPLVRDKTSFVTDHLKRYHDVDESIISACEKLALDCRKVWFTAYKPVPSFDWNEEKHLTLEYGFSCPEALCSACGTYASIATHISKKHHNTPSVFPRCYYKRPFMSLPGIVVQTH